MTIISTTTNTLTYFHAKDTPDWLVHGFFGRTGGVSTGNYHSLNCKLRCDDDLDKVQENRNRVLNVMGLDGSIVVPYQVHGNNVAIADESWLKNKPDTYPHADAIMSQLPNQLCGILTADCTPLLFYDAEKRIVAAAHAGWRGALAGVVQNTLHQLQEMGCRHIHGLMGPSIFPENYDVGLDVYELFIKQHSDNKLFFTPHPHIKAKFLFDLRAYIRHYLQQFSLDSLLCVAQDTYANDALFFSCRRATHQRQTTFGCQLSVIGIKK